MTALDTKALLEGVTPGPWIIIPAAEYDGDDEELLGALTSPPGIEGADGSPVCVFGTLEGSGELFENECDYRLIAEAPRLARRVIELEEALAQLAHAYHAAHITFGADPEQSIALQKARAALKGEGE